MVLLSCCHSPCKLVTPRPCISGLRLQLVKQKAESARKMKGERRKAKGIRKTGLSCCPLASGFSTPPAKRTCKNDTIDGVPNPLASGRHDIVLMFGVTFRIRGIISPSPKERGWGEVTSNYLSYPRGVPIGRIARW